MVNKSGAKSKTLGAISTESPSQHDQDNAAKRLSTETVGSVKDGKKREDKQNNPESMYAVVDKSRAKSKTLGAISTEDVSQKDSRGGKDGTKLNRGTDTALQTSSDCSNPSERQKPTVAVKALPVPGRVASGQKPPRVIPYHLSKRRASTMTHQAQAGLEQTADRGEDGLVKDDPRQRNVECLIYADLNLSRGSARIINTEEETLYADIGNKN